MRGRRGILPSKASGSPSMIGPEEQVDEHDYERKRHEKIAQNKRRLEELGLAEAAEVVRASKQRQPAQKKKSKAGAAAGAPQEPPRRSARERREVNYAESSLQAVLAQAPAEQPSFDPSEGTRDSQGRLVFPGFPDFRPNLTPKQVIQAGSFGGIYFNPAGGKPGILGPSVDIEHSEFPADWFEGLPAKAYRARIYTVATNKYKVKAGQDQAFWEGKGWINPQDPRGWMQWYCRFYMGRRSEDDARQISRWKGVVGDKGRWVRALVNKIIRSNKRFDDVTVSPVIRQTLLHWAFELTEEEFERMRAQL